MYRFFKHITRITLSLALFLLPATALAASGDGCSARDFSALIDQGFRPCNSCSDTLSNYSTDVVYSSDSDCIIKSNYNCSQKSNCSSNDIYSCKTADKGSSNCINNTNNNCVSCTAPYAILQTLCGNSKSCKSNTTGALPYRQSQLKTSTTTTATTTNNSVSNSLSVSEYAVEVVRLVNVERAKENLPALTIDDTLSKAAMLRSREIGTTFSHTRPDGTSCFTALQEVGASYHRAGENIAIGQTTPQEVVSAWMNSSGHRANIMNINYTRIGVAVAPASGQFNGYAWVQFFAD